MSANRDTDRCPWIVTCDLCEQTTIELPADLSVEALGEALKALDWQLPIYGGTFEPKCWAIMRKLNDRNRVLR